jgi:hypothetical protein
VLHLQLSLTHREVRQNESFPASLYRAFRVAPLPCSLLSYRGWLAIERLSTSVIDRAPDGLRHGRQRLAHSSS